MENEYSFSDLQVIIARLRSENGCPWDRAQTHLSLRPCLVEEAAEVLAAIRIYEEEGDDENLIEELGDLLLQVLMHSQIAEDEGRFSVNDVIQGISQKMIRRHPHVFGSAAAGNPEEALQNWESIKREEKEGKKVSKGELHDIPQELPSFSYAQKVLKKAEKKYGVGEKIEQNIASARMLLDKLEENENMSGSEKEQWIAEYLYQAASISRHLGTQGEQALNDKIKNIISQLEP